MSNEDKWSRALAGIRSTHGLELIPDHRQFFSEEGGEIVDAFKFASYIRSFEKDERNRW